MYIFSTKVPIWVNCGGSWNGMCWYMYFTYGFWYILWPFGLFCGSLIHFTRFGILYQEKMWQTWLVPIHLPFGLSSSGTTPNKTRTMATRVRNSSAVSCLTSRSVSARNRVWSVSLWENCHATEKSEVIATCMEMPVILRPILNFAPRGKLWPPGVNFMP
jgi:hypothetical protein